MRAAESWSVWTLRSHLSAMLLASLVLTLGLAACAVLWYRIPRIAQDSQQALLHEVRETVARMELLLGMRQSRLELLASLLQGPASAHAQALLDRSVVDGDMFRVVYRVSPQGQVVAVGLPAASRALRSELLGADLSSQRLFGALAGRPGVAWDGRYLSVLTGELTAGLAYRSAGGELLIAEVPLRTLLDTVDAAAGAGASTIWVVDERGEVIADTGRGQDAGRNNIRTWPLMQTVLQGGDGSQVHLFPDGDARVATAHSPALGWYFVGRTPVGLRDPQVRALVLAIGGAFLSCLAIGLLMAPFWAGYLARPLHRIAARAAQVLHGTAAQADRPGPVKEFHRLSRHLTAMATALHERELKFHAIFNASPVPMVLTDARDSHRLLDANDAWCHALQYRRDQVLGRTGAEIGLVTAGKRDAMDRQVQGAGVSREGTLRRADGQLLQVRLSVQVAHVGAQRWRVWAFIDLGPMRRMEQQLRELNQELEGRVKQRTEALAQSNMELSQTVAQLRLAQRNLVRAEKMAALGGLVAGVAHELNTPLGNGVMAVSAMADATHSFKAALQAGLRRGDVQQLVDSLEQGADIAGRNLRRAAELVHSFKQVAVDQTSAQRRSFELAEVVHEMVVSLKPSFAHDPWQIEVDVPASGLRLDSYPGALGQALGNLIQNAVVHGFEGRTRGTVRITAGRGQDGRVWLHVADDGRGIAAEHLDRIFDPFMTTKMGRGGTGLGLHISYNAVVNLLGGSLTVRSAPGQGACFDMRLPDHAPDAPRESGWMA